MKTVSVIIPAYNAEAYLRETIESVLAQDYPATEVVVVDDGSKDSTAAICASYGDRIQFRQQPNSGGCSAPRNHGYRICKGDYICFFDADDLMAAGRLSDQVRFLDSHPNAVAVLTDYQNFDENGPAQSTHFATCDQLRAATGFDRSATDAVVLDGETARRILVTENFSIAGTPLYRREVLDRTGVFDETLKASEDFDLIYRVAQVGDLGILRRVGFHRRLHASNMSWDSARIIEYKIRSRSKLLESERSLVQRGRLRRALNGLYRQSALHNAKAKGHSWLRQWVKSVTVGHAVSPATLADLLRCVRYQYFLRRAP